jgi:hypothetical protein
MFACSVHNDDDVVPLLIDFEGIVSVGDVLYAVSENSMLYAFEWEEEGWLETIGR